MSYIALKPCKFSKNYFVGGIIPSEEVSDGMVKKLIEAGLITKYEDNKPEEPPIVVEDKKPEIKKRKILKEDE